MTGDRATPKYNRWVIASLVRWSAATTLLLWPLLLCLGVAAEPTKLRLEEIFADPGLTGPVPKQFQWSPDGRTLTYILPREDGESRDLWAVTPASGEKRVLVSHKQLSQLAPSADKAAGDERERERLLRYSVAAYRWSPDSQSILFTSGGHLYLYDVSAEKARPIAEEKKDVRDPKFSPNGRWISFLHEHDLWLAPASGGETRQLTTGADRDLLHGDLDWVYPEEFGIRSGYAWSPDSRHVAFLEIDQSPVPEYPITYLTPVKHRLDLQRYPKPGDPNPRVRVGVIAARPGNSKKPRIVWVKGEAEYTPRFSWAGDELLAVQRLNRGQNKTEIVFADAVDGRTRTVLKEKSPHWINVTDDLTFVKDPNLKGSEEFLWTSERSGFRHIEVHGYNGKRKRTLTGGEWEVKAIEGVDEKGGWVYYTANEDNPLGSDLYRIKLDGSGKERLTRFGGSHSVKLNSNATAYSDQHSALGVAPQWDVRHLPSDRTTVIHRAKPLDDFGLVKPELIEWTTDDKALVRALMLKPRAVGQGGGQGAGQGKKHPALLYVYGGPRAPTIRDAWGGRGRYLFHQYLVQKGYVVFYVDDRASSRLGHRYETALSRDYGPLAANDYEFAAAKIKAMDFVDPERVGVWGWSGGGFSTCFVLTHSKAFKLGIAVAPVTDWRLYDSIYTERYMGLPDKEAEAYRRTSAVEAAADLHGRLLLVHPTADDNVHFQNTVAMIDALVEAGKPYDLLLYPGKTHSLHGSKARLHLFRSIERYLDSHL